MIDASRPPVQLGDSHTGYRLGHHGRRRSPFPACRDGSCGVGGQLPYGQGQRVPTIPRRQRESSRPSIRFRDIRRRKVPSTADKPAITIADLAKTLKTDARTLRAFVRGLELGCGRGSRYAWPSMTDPAVKRIVAKWEAAQVAGAPETKAEA